MRSRPSWPPLRAEGAASDRPCWPPACSPWQASRSAARLPDWRSTRALFERDVAGDRYHREGRFNLALAYAQEGRFAEAKRHLDVLIALRAERDTHPSYLPEALALETWCVVNEALAAQSETASFYEAEQRRSPTGLFPMPGVVECAARSYETLGRSQAALAAYQRAFQASGQPSALLGAIRSALRLGDRARAAQLLQALPAAARRDPALRSELAPLERALAPPAAPRDLPPARPDPPR